MPVPQTWGRPIQNPRIFVPMASPARVAPDYSDDRDASRYYSPACTLGRPSYSGMAHNSVTIMSGPIDGSAYMEEQFTMPVKGTVTLRVWKQNAADNPASYKVYIGQTEVLGTTPTTGVFMQDIISNVFEVAAGTNYIRVVKVGGSGGVMLDQIAYEFAPQYALPNSLLAPFSGNDFIDFVTGNWETGHTLKTLAVGEVEIKALNNNQQFKYSNKQGVLFPNTEYFLKFQVKADLPKSMLVAGENSSFSDLGLTRRFSPSQFYRTVAVRFTTSNDYRHDDYRQPSSYNPITGLQKDSLPQFVLSNLAPITLTLNKREMVLWDSTVHALPCADEAFDVSGYQAAQYWLLGGGYGQYGGYTSYGRSSLTINKLAVACWLDFYTTKAADLASSVILVDGAGGVTMNQYSATTIPTNINGTPTASILVPAGNHVVTVDAGPNGCSFDYFHLRIA